MVGMMMRREDRGEVKLLAREIVEHRPRLAGSTTAACVALRSVQT